ncbi:MAG: T9SS type A sorting domain-containing protein [Chitinophagaceae bacterium]|nr:T9SS type A sorting domain-containing protein [Chitinophagaceae bacterium]
MEFFIESNTGTITTELYNNSVSLNGSTSPNASSICIAMNSVSKTSLIKNNVFANFTPAQTGVAYHACFYTNAASQYGSASSLSDNNNFYIADTSNGYLFKAITSNYKTLAAWQAAMTLNPGTDANSQVANPYFVNNVTDLHGTSLSVSLDGTGTTPPEYFTTDIDCQARTAPHDIGFDDFASCVANGGIASPAAATICAGKTFVMSATGVSENPFVTYQWMVAETEGGPYADVIDGSGATTTTYTTAKTKKGTFYYVLKATCPSGGSAFSNEVVLEVNPLPTATVTPEGPVAFCNGDEILLTASDGNNRAYQWFDKEVLIDGETNITYLASVKGNYKVRITNTLTGCVKTSDPVKVTVYKKPEAIITPQGPTTFCIGESVVLQANTGSGYTYKWKKGSDFISGATESSYTATEQSNYKVEVSNANGCSKLSDNTAVTVNCKLDGEMQTDVTFAVFPNPATDRVNILLATTTDFEVELTNLTGDRIVLMQNENTIDVSNLAAGVYFIKISTAEQSVVKKLVKE